MLELKKVLLTGADGFTGKHLFNHLENNEYKCIPLQSNLLSKNDLVNEISSYDFDYVIHLAAVSNPAEKDKNIIYEVNVDGTKNLLDSLINKKKFLKKIILSSSANVYSRNIEGQINLNSLLKPFNDYGKSKLEMEKTSFNYQKDFNISITRPFNYTGNGQDENFIIPKLVNSFKEEIPKLELGNIEVYREYNDVRDICEIYKILLEDDRGIDKINLCSGNYFNIKEIIERLERISKKKLSVEISTKYFRKGDSNKLFGNPNMINNFLKYEFKYSIDDTLKWMLNS